jgi:hypothetical protein
MAAASAATKQATPIRNFVMVSPFIEISIFDHENCKTGASGVEPGCASRL